MLKMGTARAGFATVSLCFGAAIALGHGGETHDHADETSVGFASLTEVWSAIRATRDAIAGDAEAGRLDSIPSKAESLPGLGQALLMQLDPGSRPRVAAQIQQLAAAAEDLTQAGVAGDRDRTHRELERLDELLRQIGSLSGI